jgi:chaperonin GroES
MKEADIMGIIDKGEMGIIDKSEMGIIEKTGAAKKAA